MTLNFLTLIINAAVLSQNTLILRKYTLMNLRGKEHHACNLFSNISENSLHTGRDEEGKRYGKRGRMLTAGNWGGRQERGLVPVLQLWC